MHYTERIRTLREDRDKRQSDIAALLNVGQRTYCDYELGKTRIPVDSLIILAKLPAPYLWVVAIFVVPFATTLLWSQNKNPV
mgnify:CR=1 FL=1